MTRIHCRLVALVLLLVIVAHAAIAEDRKPNVIFIIVDDMKREEIGFLSPKTALTPNLDRLAREGVYFPNGFATSTVCTPSRYTCITGRYPSQCTGRAFTSDISEEGMTRVSFNTHVEPDRPNIPRMMQQNGYTTGMVGKWHIGMHGYREEVPSPGSEPSDPEVAAMLRRNQDALSDAMKKYGFDYAKNIYAGNAMDSRALKNTGLTQHNMEWLTEAALEFIDNNRNKPFYLYFSTTLPHSPKPIESVKGDPRITAGGLLKKPITVQPDRSAVLKRVVDAGLPETAAGSAWIDDGIGAILSKLEELGVDNSTLILFFNDHGMELGSKSSLYDGATRTPILARWPGRIRPGLRPDVLVSNIDFAPTIYDAAGITPPKAQDIRGLNFLPIAEGKAADNGRKYIYSEIGYTRALTGKEWKYLAFRTPPSIELTTEESMRVQKEYLDELRKKHAWVKWQPDPDAKITHTGGPPGGDFLMRLVFQTKSPFLKNYYDPDQLYNLKKDPGETTNLAGAPEYVGKLREMKGQMTRILSTLPGTFADLKPTAED